MSIVQEIDRHQLNLMKDGGGLVTRGPLDASQVTYYVRSSTIVPVSGTREGPDEERKAALTVEAPARAYSVASSPGWLAGRLAGRLANPWGSAPQSRWLLFSGIWVPLGPLHA